VCTAALVHRVGTSRTQRERQFGIAFVRKDAMIQILEGRSLHLIIPSLSKQSGGQSAPTYYFG